ncbi:MAG: hypothetical protein HQ522_14685 [Bacteroidetes bacterium]|nr:hypothetical protein [Bacteroidota bacterium]
MEKILFKEEQRMHHPRMIVVLPIVFFIIIIYIISSWIRLNYSNKAFDLTEITINEFLILGVIIFSVLGLLLAYAHSCSLKTKISNTGIWLSYSPFHKKWKKVDTNQIRSYRIRKYHHLREYYGHGKRDHWKSGKAYTISEDIGLQLYFKNGKKLLIGTQNKQAIEYAMKKLMREGKTR